MSEGRVRKEAILVERERGGATKEEGQEKIVTKERQPCDEVLNSGRYWVLKSKCNKKESHI